MELRIPLEDAELAVRVAGDDEASRPVVWAHPLTSSMATEDAVPLVDWGTACPTGCRLVRYDARGHGVSAGGTAPDEYRWTKLADDQVALFDALELDRVVLGGASMGAATALHTAVRHPDRVDALVLTIPPTAWATRSKQARLYKGGARLVSTLGHAAYDRAVRLAPPAPILRSPDLRPWHDEMVRGMSRIEKHRLAAILRGAADSDLPPLDELAAAVGNTPVLLLAWETDHGHPSSTARQLAEALPRAELHLADTPAEVAEWSTWVRSFLARL